MSLEDSPVIVAEFDLDLMREFESDLRHQAVPETRPFTKTSPSSWMNQWKAEPSKHDQANGRKDRDQRPLVRCLSR
jgi:hypothetical protein